MSQRVETAIRVSSRNLDPGEIVRGREGFMKLNMNLDFTDRSRTGSRFAVLARSFGPVGIGRINGAPASFFRRREHLADNRDLISIVISDDARFCVEGVRGRDRYGARGAAVLESRRESALHSLDYGLAWMVCMERAPLEPLLAGIQEPIQRCLAEDNPGVRLLQGYLGLLLSLQQDCDRTLATLHIRDLALHALGVSGDTQALVRERGVQAARQGAVLGAIASRASEPGLAPACVAERLGMSVRYLHRLLESTGRSFAEHLLERRLDRASGMLRDRSCALKIAEIAAQAGFADISSFNRSFRRAFGDTPYGLRVRAARATHRESGSPGDRLDSRGANWQ
jgi:AraC-like DNA-binding protein